MTHRVIKFRAYDKPDNLMYCDIHKGISFEDGSHYSFADFIENKGYHKFEIMQYTGLKDKNGVEIYEGDIVACKGWDRYSEEYSEWNHNEEFSDSIDEALEAKIPIININIDIVTMERFPTYWLKNEEFGYEGDDLQDPEGYEVVGNIYENPELIK